MHQGAGREDDRQREARHRPAAHRRPVGQLRPQHEPAHGHVQPDQDHVGPHGEPGPHPGARQHHRTGDTEAGDVQLVGDVHEPLDQHPSHRRPAEALPEDPRGRRLRLLGRAREDDPAALAAPADLHLRLDRDLTAQSFGDRTSLRWSFGHPPVGEGDPVRREEILPLMLVEIQPVSSLPTRPDRASKALSSMLAAPGKTSTCRAARELLVTSTRRLMTAPGARWSTT